MTQRLYIVDVFAERRYAGNPLAVVIGERYPDADTMQRIAAEMNFSETTFVRAAPEASGAWRVRIFTPARELDFAGHPILGTAWVLREHVAAQPPARVVLELSVGRVPVTFEPAPGGGDTAWFAAPPMTLGTIPDLGELTGALGLAADDIDPRAPAQVVAAGTAAVIVPLRSLDALRRARLDLDAYAPLAAAGCPPLVYLFCAGTRDARNDLSARFFFEAHGVREDPATGNGAAFLGAYLLEHRLLGGDDLDLRIEQGHDLGRPSLVMVRARMHDGAREISVGGRVIETARGELVTGDRE